MNCTTKTSVRTFVENFFSPSGTLAQRFRGYEYRLQQAELSMAVHDFLEHPSLGIIAAEAPPGVGKTFAVLVPAILRARQEGKRILFLTAGIALQEQLIEKDLPRLATLLGCHCSYGLLKGRGNYACLRRGFSFRDGGYLDVGEGSMAFDIPQWLEETAGGDLAELSLPSTHPLLFKIGAFAEGCLGTSCPFRERCFVTRLYREAQEWDIVVANYHLYFSHILGGKGSFPVPYDWLICDEAHRISDAARNASTISAELAEGQSYFRPRTLQGFESLLMRHGIDATLFKELALHCRECIDRLFGLAETRYHPNEGISERDEELFYKGEEAGAAIDKLLGTIRSLEERFMAGGFENSLDLGEVAGLINWMDEVREFRKSLAWCLKVERFPLWGYWRGAGSFSSAPVHCGGIIKEALESEAPEKIVAISATLSLGGEFSFWSRETGVVPDTSLIVQSPFHFETQMEIDIVDIGVPVTDTSYDSKICRVVEKLCDENGGRTLVLLSSIRLLRCLSAYMRSHEKSYDILVQGDLPQRALLHRFREDELSVLIGSVSFREGVDVPGEGLTQVIIDRIPFPHPFDPLVQARNALEGQKAFGRVTLPNAKMFLRQAVGRLIRSSTDRGRVVLLDGRVTEKKGWKILEDLPPCKCRHLIIKQ